MPELIIDIFLFVSVSVGLSLCVLTLAFVSMGDRVFVPVVCSLVFCHIDLK